MIAERISARNRVVITLKWDINKIVEGVVITHLSCRMKCTCFIKIKTDEISGYGLVTEEYVLLHKV